MEGCIFCKIIKGEIKAYKVYEDEYALAFLDINPVYKGHVLFIPKRHYSRFSEMPEDYACEFSKSLNKFLKIFEKKVCKDYNIVVNQGKKAGQVVMHLHVHIIPRTDSEERLFVWKTHKLSEEEAKEVLSKFSE